MKTIIYYNDTGFPYSVLVAAVRSGALPAHRLPERRELKKVLGACGVGGGDAAIFNLGCGRRGEVCLALWTSGNGDMVKRIVSSFLGLFSIEDYELVEVPLRKTPLLTLGARLVRLRVLEEVGFLLIWRCLAGLYPCLVRAAGA